MGRIQPEVVKYHFFWFEGPYTMLESEPGLENEPGSAIGKQAPYPLYWLSCPCTIYPLVFSDSSDSEKTSHFCILKYHLHYIFILHCIGSTFYMHLKKNTMVTGFFMLQFCFATNKVVHD